MRTVYRWFARLRDDGTWETINYYLVMRDRERSGREASPTAAVIDSQSVKTTESGGVRGYDAGKKVKDRKRHALVDTDGRALKLQPHAADIQDRNGAGPLLRASRPSWPFVQCAFADAGYQGPRVAAASPIGQRRRGYHRVVRSLPLRRFSSPAAATARTLTNRFETDSEMARQHDSDQRHSARRDQLRVALGRLRDPWPSRDFPANPIEQHA